MRCILQHHNNFWENLNKMNGTSNQISSVPHWLREDALEDNTINSKIQGPPGYAPVGGQVPNSGAQQPSKLLHWSLKMMTMVLCTLMCATAVIGLRKLFVLYIVFILSFLYPYVPCL